MRPNAERPVTVSVGTNTIVGSDPHVIIDAVAETLAGHVKAGATPDLWDGRASERVADVLVHRVSRG